jgi:hypothetical protein
MKTSKFTFVFSVVVASAAMLFTSCNQLNNEINSLNKKADPVKDSTVLTISGVIDNYHGECDELRAFSDIHSKNLKTLGVCKVGSKGEFTLKINPIVDMSDTIGASDHLFYMASKSDRNTVLATGLQQLYTYKNGKNVGGIVKWLSVDRDSTQTSTYSTLFLYSTKAFSNPGATFDKTYSNYFIKKGWTELAFRCTFNSKNPNYYSLTDSVPSGTQWTYCTGLPSTSIYKGNAPLIGKSRCGKIRMR